jgi:uncharacterized protein YjbI with pentapeptide repeats
MLSISRITQITQPAPVAKPSSPEQIDSNTIADILTDQRADNSTLINFLIDVFDHKIQSRVNEIITSINAASMYDVVVFNAQVISALADQGIELIQHRDNTIELQAITFASPDPRRQREIDRSLENVLPKEITSLVSSYDDQIKISIQNYELIHTAFTSADPALKRQIIHNSIAQKQVLFLNEVFEEIRFLHGALDLSLINLTGFKLNGFKLLKTNFSGANLSGADLTDADLSDCNLTNANLTLADLTRADLTRSDLTSANLYRAQLHQTDLYRTNLATANLRGTNMRTAMATFALLTQRQVYMDCRKSDEMNFTGARAKVILFRHVTGPQT